MLEDSLQAFFSAFDLPDVVKQGQTVTVFGRLFPMESRPLVIRTTKTGVVTAVVQWIELDLDGETRYRNRPADPEAESHWTQILYRFPRPFEVEAGNTIMLVVGHNRQQLWLKLRV